MHRGRTPSLYRVSTNPEYTPTDVEAKVWGGSESELDKAIAEAGDDPMNSENFIEVKSGKNSAGTGVPGVIDQGSEHSFTGELSSQITGESIAHEFGHLLGLPHPESPRDPGWGDPPSRGGIMSYARNRNVMNEEVESALRKPVSGHKLKKSVMWNQEVRTRQHVGARIKY